MQKIYIFIILVLFWIKCPAQDMKICDCNGFDMQREIVSSTEIKEEEPCYFSETAPVFPGGSDKLTKFIRKNSSYQILQNSNPNTDAQYESVFVCLMIDKSGSIIENKIRTTNDAFRVDVLKVVSLMPTWIPAKQSKIPIMGRYTFELKYEKK